MKMSDLSSQQKQRLIYQLMKDDAKEISLNSRVTESMSLGTRRINEMPSSTEWCPEALQVSDDVLDCKKYRNRPRRLSKNASVRQEKSYEDASVNAIESWIARWLRYATDREGSKEEKKYLT